MQETEQEVIEPNFFIVVALACEASFFLSYFSMKEEKKSFRKVYRSQDKKTVLAISKIGEKNAFDTVLFLSSLFPNVKEALWLNFGLAGHSCFSLGDLFWADTIIKEKERFYPSLVFQKGGKSSSLKTVKEPSFSYKDFRCGYDMEAFGFFQASRKKSFLEFCQVLKIVSDTPSEKISFSSKEATKLIQKNEKALKTELEALLLLQKKWEEKKQEVEKPFEKAKSLWHCTVTQTHQLKELLVQYQVGFKQEPCFKASSSKEFIQKLSQELKKNPLDFSDYDPTPIL